MEDTAQSVRPGFVSFGPAEEGARRKSMAEMLRSAPIPDGELLYNTGLFLTPQTLSRILFMDFLYRRAMETQGVVLEFGCRWGQNLSLFSAMRGIYEPFNRLRKVVGFDTFEGFPSVAPEDRNNFVPGDFSTTLGYEKFLAQWLALQEHESPLGHITKHEIVKGDVTKTLPQYLRDNPQTIISLAYFDLDIFEPTKKCLQAIEPYITKGTVIGFDELNDSVTPGETAAVREVFGLGRYAIKRVLYSARTSYLVVE